MFSICIYDNYDEDNMIVNHTRQDVTVQTDMEGGFRDASFSIPYNPNISINYWINKHVVIFDMYGDRVFEGFCDKPKMSGNFMSIKALGYFEKGSKLSAGPIYFSGHLEGALVYISVDTAGSGYAVDEVLALTTGGSEGTVVVDRVGDSGEVEEVLIRAYGYGYSTGTSSTTGGGGASCVVSIDAVETGSTSYFISKFMTDLNQ